MKLFQHECIIGVHKSLMRQYKRSFIVPNKIENVAYKVKLHKILSQLYPIYLISLLKLFHKNLQDLSRDVLVRAPTNVMDEYNKVTKDILTDYIIWHKKRAPIEKYMVCWRGLHKFETSWESAAKLWQFENLKWVYKEN